jgi:hypothetical protein
LAQAAIVSTHAFLPSSAPSVAMVFGQCTTATRQTYSPYLWYLTESELVWFDKVRFPCYRCQAISNPLELEVMDIKTVCSGCGCRVEEMIVFPCNYSVCQQCLIVDIECWAFNTRVHPRLCQRYNERGIGSVYSCYTGVFSSLSHWCHNVFNLYQ